MSLRTLLTTAAFAVLAACATSGQSQLSYEEASAFENALLARESAAPQEPERLFVQPVNKTEACMLPTSQDQLDRPNFRAFWDGDCKSGFAFGLGRDFAISDTHHVEEITVHDGTGGRQSQAGVTYDYVNQTVIYWVTGSQWPETIALGERFQNSIQGFNVGQMLNGRDNVGGAINIVSSAFHPQRTYLLTQNYDAVAFKFTDLSVAPATDPKASRVTVEVFDPTSKLPGGISIAILADGSFRQVRTANGVSEAIFLPEAYRKHLTAKYDEISSFESRANAELQSAQQIEREYLYKACNGSSGISGLDNATYTKICTWRDQFREPYAIASANYQQQLENLRQQASTAEQQRQIQQQIALQQQILQQQQSQQAWNQLNQTTQQLQQQTQSTLSGLTNMQLPQVQPIVPPGGDKVICNSVGTIVICR